MVHVLNTSGTGSFLLPSPRFISRREGGLHVLLSIRTNHPKAIQDRDRNHYFGKDTSALGSDICSIVPTKYAKNPADQQGMDHVPRDLRSDEPRAHLQNGEEQETVREAVTTTCDNPERAQRQRCKSDSANSAHEVGRMVCQMEGEEEKVQNSSTHPACSFAETCCYLLPN